MQWYKTMTTDEYIRGVKRRGWKPFPGRLWQRNYFDHIIRSKEALTIILEYIMNNPRQWPIGRENPRRRGENPFSLWLSSYCRPETPGKERK